MTIEDYIRHQADEGGDHYDEFKTSLSSEDRHIEYNAYQGRMTQQLLFEWFFIKDLIKDLKFAIKHRLNKCTVRDTDFCCYNARRIKNPY